MPYYAGDYYVGDPGFSFKKLGRWLGKAGKAVVKVATSPVGSIVTSLIPGASEILNIGKGLLSRGARGGHEALASMGLGGAGPELEALMRDLGFGAAGGTPGAVAHAGARARRGVATRRRYYRTRRRRRY